MIICPFILYHSLQQQLLLLTTASCFGKEAEVSSEDRRLHHALKE